MATLFDSFKAGGLNLKNKIVMAPMTRSRATTDHIPTPIMADYYGQRSGAGLIITEGTSPSPNGVGYPRIPGLYNQPQVDAWKVITDRVHKEGSKIFLQIMHTGRISHPLNLPEGAEVLAPSAIPASNTKMYTDQEGEKNLPTPKEMTDEDIASAINEYVNSAKLAVAAGFDGVELHAANGYLLEQFINPGSNQRTDNYGGSVENRARFVIEVAEQTVEAIGKDKVGIRLSPGGAFNDIMPFEGQEETYKYLAEELGKIGLVYVHLVDHSSMGTPEVPKSLKETIRDAFGGTIIISGGYDKAKAEKDLADGLGHLVAFGRPFISNPDLPERMKEGAELADPDFSTFYTPGEKGYTDYPTLQKA
ncbi:alkene reductase [Fulvivirga lutea]|uniref:Alkene reductase n=1 Tax=Fulvivirga lutea TaxID=2810512 RepID=A0A974WIZ9_9BACT|nr:alkene reductase [Fulvivirga lutea]QSE99060.1 alkene reductase [Fulvivirga lutea]